ncbi:hypothetical protein U1Q18_030481 [Sarracenia purpurea var. burkii]
MYMEMNEVIPDESGPKRMLPMGDHSNEEDEACWLGEILTGVAQVGGVAQLHLWSRAKICLRGPNDVCNMVVEHFSIFERAQRYLELMPSINSVEAGKGKAGTSCDLVEVGVSSSMLLGLVSKVKSWQLEQSLGNIVEMGQVKCKTHHHREVPPYLAIVAVAPCDRRHRPCIAVKSMTHCRQGVNNSLIAAATPRSCVLWSSATSVTDPVASFGRQQSIFVLKATVALAVLSLSLLLLLRRHSFFFVRRLSPLVFVVAIEIVPSLATVKANFLSIDTNEPNSPASVFHPVSLSPQALTGSSSPPLLLVYRYLGIIFFLFSRFRSNPLSFQLLRLVVPLYKPFRVKDKLWLKINCKPFAAG